MAHLSEDGPDSILAVWLAQEVLTPQALPSLEDLQSQHQRLFRLEETPEPWADARNAKFGKERGLYWFLCLGEMPLQPAMEELVRQFPDEYPEEKASVRGTTTLAVAVLDEEGKPLVDKVFISSFPWGMGQVRLGQLHDLASFPDAESRLRSELNDRLFQQDEHGEPLAVTDFVVTEATAWLRKRLAVPSKLLQSHGLALRVPVRSFRDAPEPELLNSFFLDDLARVRQAWSEGRVGQALRLYLDGKAAQPRCDVRRATEELEEVLAPSRLPLARWPIPGGHSLVLMQQAAINHAASELQSEGLVGINGPPGTGKTTLLRDVVAKVVFDRARALAQFETPDEAFSHVATMKLGKAFTHLYKLHESLIGHEIVVASSNNKAVENISREIPASSALPSDIAHSTSYFSSIADCVAAGDSKHIEPGRAWGLAAAVLGNKANRYAFSQAFWWHRERGMSAYLKAVATGWDPALEDTLEDLPEAAQLENGPPNAEEALQRWSEARQAFRLQQRVMEKMLTELEAGREASKQRQRLEQALGETTATLASLATERESIQRDYDKATGELEQARSLEQDSIARRQDHLLLRPGFFARLFRTRKYRSWQEDLTPILTDLEHCRTARQKADTRARDIQAARAATDFRIAQETEHLEKLQKQHRACVETIRRAEHLAGGHLPDDEFWSRSSSEIQKDSPWMGREIQIARDTLFADAFRLHKAFIDAAAKKLRHNLGAALAVMQGRALSGKQEPARQSLWASLFLVVPVISTTFASTSRLFGPLGPETLGWLLIDEAGQALPQAAVGAIWRSRRAIVIGDPMQIEPVVPTPAKLLRSLYQKFEVEPDHWAAPWVSAQVLADRASWFGTSLVQEDGDLWIGCPLRVHRRCEQPMLSISNHIAYGGFMVDATPERPSQLGNLLGRSRWIDIQSERTQGKWSAAEGEVALRLLSSLLENDTNLEGPDIFLITPFRLVAQKLRQLVAASSFLASKLPQPTRRWAQERIGTVHTFQGKEAEAVVFVLGAPTQESAGARRWAGARPNLLNVAVSRAKQKLYVVGCREAWKDIGVFQTLAMSLPVDSSFLQT